MIRYIKSLIDKVCSYMDSLELDQEMEKQAIARFFTSGMSTNRSLLNRVQTFEGGIVWYTPPFAPSYIYDKPNGLIYADDYAYESIYHFDRDMNGWYCIWSRIEGKIFRESTLTDEYIDHCIELRRECTKKL